MTQSEYDRLSDMLLQTRKAHELAVSLHSRHRTIEAYTVLRTTLNAQLYALESLLIGRNPSR
jgi:hypothetical protein